MFNKPIVFALLLAILSQSADAGPRGAVRRHPVATMIGVLAVTAAWYGRAHKNTCTGDDCPTSAAEPIKDETGKTYLKAEREPRPSNQKFRKNLTVARNKELRLPANTPPPDDCDAHHIVPKTENRKEMREHAANARASLDDCVDIDSPENGIFLPNRPEGSENCPGRYHRAMHNVDYYQTISGRLKEAYETDKCRGVKNALKSIKEDLRNGLL